MNANKIKLSAEPSAYNFLSTVNLYIQLMSRSALFALKYPETNVSSGRRKIKDTEIVEVRDKGTDDTKGFAVSVSLFLDLIHLLMSKN